MVVFEHSVWKWGAFESNGLRTADLEHFWIFRWSDYSRIVSYYFTDLLGFSFKSGEFERTKNFLSATVPTSQSWWWNDDSALRRYYIKIFMLWKPLTTFLPTELTLSPSWSHSNRLQAAKDHYCQAMSWWAILPGNRETLSN